ncbi:type 2 lanthipeptide synthetase LanM [Staphylococcus agnetis]|uniref:type 2 lanthipeptide synthetase LanM n=1 Tax=Staphylococcus agnetis TaxID=985762 RepID=UPI00208EB66E|nr:type 2 lanthipeptide synthetase LanM [Staphylococcus agnetis]MCO4327808.1 type 2 lanthipeptide synthetase LanM [Staphylococcus agnetis]MCO4353493.1 type 2 lanthipeptide synthetase LanM [Staphylococcus agnetis]MCO4370187.1 type 2 lanthipeptide synthetase LanM [Staphylococcus agnetis]
MEHIKAFTINERVKYNLTKENDEKTEQWFKRKSLLSSENIAEMIEINYGDYNSFTKGIGDIEINDFKYNDNKYTPWVSELETYLKEFEDIYKEDKKTIDYSIRFLVQGVRRKIKSLLNNNRLFNFKEEVTIEIVEAYISEIMSILNQTIIFDMHNYKQRNGLLGNDKYERFQYYLLHRFGDKNRIREFYHNFPYLIRIVMLRTKFFIENIRELIYRLDEEFECFKRTLGINSNIIVSINLSMGDTHDGGKSVAILHFSNNEKIVYKPKNLEVASKVSKFMEYLNFKYNTDFYISKRLVKTCYSFEEFISQNEISDQRNLHKYYENYGELIALVYILNGSDFHYENIIANGIYPVIIDMETFLHEASPLKQKEQLKNVIRDYIAESVIGSSMLPVKIMKERTENQLNGIDLSGLSFGKVDIPFNILGIKDAGTDEMRYEWIESNASESNNAPTHNGEIVQYENYKPNIYEGFQKLIKTIIDNKKDILQFIEGNFTNLKIRQIVRPTQKYADLLRYSYHPTCMENAIEREKVLQNLWAYSLTDKNITKYEFEEMMNGDIPQFFINTNSTSIYSNNGFEIENVYKETPLQIIKRKINNLNDDIATQQSNIIKTTLQDFKFQNYIDVPSIINKNNEIESSIISILKMINNKITERLIISEENRISTILDINDGFESELLSLSEGLYNGLSGIYLFLVINDYINKDIDNEEYIEYLRNTIISESTMTKVNPFFGKGSLIYPLLVEYKLFNNEKILNIAEGLAKEVMQQQISSDNDWIYGSCGMIPIFKTLSKYTNCKIYSDYADDIASHLNINISSDYIGFAHGQSYIYYINKYTNTFDEKYIKSILKDENKYIINGRWRSEKNADKFFSGWCKGDLGIEISRLISFDQFSKEFTDMCIQSLNMKNNNTLCHGNASLIELLIQLKNNNIISRYDFEKMIIKIINQILYLIDNHNRLNVYSGLYGESFGLFTGTSGLGYQLARILDEKIPNVLCLEVE